MAGTKRSSPESDASGTRPSKIAKTGNTQDSSKTSDKKTTKKGKQKTTKAMHVNLTHTPPTITDPETEAVSVASADPGFIGNLTLVPSTFSTGSFGWKGSKRITVELQNSEGGEKDKVQVMLSINATVVGSKPAKADEEDVVSVEDESTEEPKQA
ncbi:hypothetical protein DXG01_008833 [Tephrocybe rancida]|nr:hypothetical protein DXG01_008833 [Tephrocybe rancida]